MIFATERLVVRRFSDADLAPLAALRNDPEVARYQTWTAFGEAEARALLDEMRSKVPGTAGWFQCAITEAATGTLIGDCGLKVLAHEKRLAEIGYTLGRAWWNRGLATELVAGLSSYAFRSLPLHRLSASVDPRNAASCRVLEKAGFVKEAHFRQSEWFKGGWADDAIYVRLRSDPEP